MRIVALSDLHGYLPPYLPACDLLLLAGDICPVEDHSLDFQARWLRTEFRSWLETRQARKIVGIAGNHDLIFEQMPEMVPRNLPWSYLQDARLEWEGLKLWGTPWQPWFFDWAFNGDPARLQRQWSLIPDDTDILIVHGPPWSYGDSVPTGEPGASTPGGGGSFRHAGCPHLLERIKEIAPRLVVFGHIHEGRGEWQLGRTTLANVTLLDEQYRVAHKPWVLEL